MVKTAVTTWHQGIHCCPYQLIVHVPAIPLQEACQNVCQARPHITLLTPQFSLAIGWSALNHFRIYMWKDPEWRPDIHEWNDKYSYRTPSLGNMAQQRHIGGYPLHTPLMQISLPLAHAPQMAISINATLNTPVPNYTQCPAFIGGKCFGRYVHLLSCQLANTCRPVAIMYVMPSLIRTFTILIPFPDPYCLHTLWSPFQ